MPQSRRLLLSLVAISVLFGGMRAAAASEGQDFVVNNKVFHPEMKEPVESTTIFSDGRVYDFLQTKDGSVFEAIIFDKPDDLIILLDPNRKMKTQFTTGEVSTQIGKLHEAARQWRKPGYVKFSATPRFSERVDAKSGAVILDGNEYIRYVVETEAPKNPFSAKIYNEAADWLAQTNALLNPSEPPFPRLKLNEVLKKRQEIPVSIERTNNPGQGRKEKKYRSEHRIQWGLGVKDKQRIDELANQLHTFNQVSFEDYHKAPEDEQARK